MSKLRVVPCGGSVAIKLSCGITMQEKGRLYRKATSHTWKLSGMSVSLPAQELAHEGMEALGS